MQTDHKALVSLLGTKLINQLPQVRIQWFQMRLMRYSYDISHDPGKSLTTATTLLRAPVCGQTASEKNLQEAVQTYSAQIFAGIQASEKRLQQIRKHIADDEVANK